MITLSANRFRSGTLRRLACRVRAALCMTLPLLAVQGVHQAQEAAPSNLSQVSQDGEYYLVQFAKDAKAQASVEEFVQVCEKVTGITFLFTESMQQVLEQKKLMGIGKRRIHKQDFYSFFQVQMSINDFVCVEVGPPQLSMVQIRSLGANGGRQATSIRQTATAVEPAELQDYADQPATLITTVLHLPNLESRTLSQALRGMMVDSTTQSLIPAGEHSIILTGFGSFVAPLAELLQDVNEKSAPRPEAQPSFEVIALRNASAVEVAATVFPLIHDLRQAAPSAAGAGAQETLKVGPSSPRSTPSVRADERSNSLLVLATPDLMERIKVLVATLDRKVSPAPEAPEAAPQKCTCQDE